jgi:zinc protease
MSGLNAVTTDDLRAYHKTHLTKDRLVVAVAGAINAQTLAAALDHVFGELPPTAPQTAYPPAVQGVGGTVALVPLDIPQTIIRIHQGGIDRSHPDWVPAQVMNYVLGGSGFGSRLMEEVREKRGLTYGIYTDFSTLTYGDRMSVSTSTKNDSVAEVLNLIKAEWIRMREHDLTAEELDAAKAYLTGSMPLALSSTNAIASMMLDLQLDRLPVDYLDTVADRIRAVTATDVRRVAQSLLKEEDFVTILVGAPKDIAPTITIKELPNVE